MSVINQPDENYNYRVRLQDSSSRRASDRVVFAATPDLIETRNVNYKTIDPVHAPGQIYAYQNTNSRTFNISSVKLISRTEEEAKKNLEDLWVLRSWTMPRFGQSSLGREQRAYRDLLRRLSESADPLWEDIYSTEARDDPQLVGSELRGSPPTVLLLSAYSLDKNKRRPQHINRVPVVIQNLSIPYPSDVDYIPAQDYDVPMPTILTLDMTLAETHSPREYERFSLGQFKNGILPGF